MNSNFSYDRCAAARVQSRMGSRCAVWAMAAACLLAPFSVGCQMGGSAGGAACHPAFDQLEQGCFGYEPTVWRAMADDCQQAIRMIPDEVVNIPPAVAAPVPVESAPPMEAEVPDEAILDDVPDRGPLDVPRIGIVEPPEDEPMESDPAEETPAETPPAVSPADVPDVPAAKKTPKQPVVPPPAEIPAAETPATEPPPVETPALPSSVQLPAKLDPPRATAPAQFAPIVTGPVARVSATRTSVTRTSATRASGSQSSAAALFRTVSQALNESSQPERVANVPSTKKPVAANLSRFISY